MDRATDRHNLTA